MEFKGTARIAENLYVDFDRAALFTEETKDKPVLLKKKPFEVLKYLLQNNGQVLTTDQIFDAVWGIDAYGDTSQVRKNIHQVRTVIKKLCPGADVIETRRDFGYIIQRGSVVFADGDEASSVDVSADEEYFRRRFDEAMIEESNGEYEIAFEIQKELAEKGYAPSINYVGVVYIKGEIVEPDVKYGVECYKKSAELGYHSAQFNLGDCYENALGVEMDKKKAVEYYILAANNPVMPDKDAMYRLYQCYKYGRGVERNPDEAERWRVLAEKHGAKKYRNFYE